MGTVNHSTPVVGRGATQTRLQLEANRKAAWVLFSKLGAVPDREGQVIDLLIEIQECQLYTDSPRMRDLLARAFEEIGDLRKANKSLAEGCKDRDASLSLQSDQIHKLQVALADVRHYVTQGKGDGLHCPTCGAFPI